MNDISILQSIRHETATRRRAIALNGFDPNKVPQVSWPEWATKGKSKGNAKKSAK